jgi:hypothetical protein
MDAFDLMNKKRTDRDLVTLRYDSRIAKIAQERAEYMADTGVFSHTQSDGTDVFDVIADSGIRWYLAGEIIAWNTAEDPATSAAMAIHAWMESPSHKAILISKDMNYAAFGLAVSSSGKRYWAGVFLKGPDRTAAWAKMVSISSSPIDSKSAKVVIKWSGADTRLQVLTSGFRYYQTRRRADGGDWYVYGTTTSTSTTRTWTRGRLWEFQVRARDKAGNWSAWKSVTIRP